MLERKIPSHINRTLLLKPLDIDAWHAVKTTDPLLDSDEENPDDHVRLDYREYNCH
jgi:hypothetical protein